MFQILLNFSRVLPLKSCLIFGASPRTCLKNIHLAKLTKRCITRNSCLHYSPSNDPNNTSQKNKLEAVLLKSRSLIRLQGPDTLSLLQGLITNDVGHFENRSTIYALFLNNQGRVLWDAILYNVKKDSDSKIFLECDSFIKNNLINHLKIFKLRKKVDIVDVEGEDKSAIDLWAVFDGTKKDLSEYAKHLVRDESSGGSSQRSDLPISVDDTVLSFGDPRLNELGWRIFVPRSKPHLFPPKDVKISEENSYKRLRYTLGVAEGVTELPTGNCFPLESNADYLHGVSFHKGCYIGQELTARTHHTGVVRKRIMPFRLLEGNFDNVDLSTLQLSASSGKKSLGKIRGVFGSVGIGLIRIDEALSSPELFIQDCKVQVDKPFWWPLEASKEIQSSTSIL